ncbi:hypothetical protein [Tropicimonas sediminicola]|uniref:Uncharacterized protein n=1 Tax=Tropicimonas sediminicola TaxID=1031541 RepID=A0A239EQT8_9RHOB|nr:hypothetical protein [Tropicimonas sediminicola]SNS47036.1 hypothetical protein SAMN05421757_102284 [Tropicimonas sediminicola]
MPQLVRLYIRQVIIGFLLSAVFVCLLMVVNVANLWHLVTHSSGGYVAVLLLWLFNGIVFAGVQFGISIMRMSQDDGDAGRGKRITFATPTVPQDGTLAVSASDKRG